MRTPKIEALHILISFMNLNYPLLRIEPFKLLEPLEPLDTSPLYSSPLYSNAWLSGMWDADGNFSIPITYNEKRATNYRV